MEKSWLVTYGHPFGDVQQALCETLQLAQVFREYCHTKGYVLTRIDSISMSYDRAKVTM